MLIVVRKNRSYKLYTNSITIKFRCKDSTQPGGAPVRDFSGTATLGCPLPPNRKCEGQPRVPSYLMRSVAFLEIGGVGSQLSPRCKMNVC
jgi:hypothetical protein